MMQPSKTPDQGHGILTPTGCLVLLAYVAFLVYNIVPGCAGAIDRGLRIETFSKVVTGAEGMWVKRLGKGRYMEIGSLDRTTSPRFFVAFRSATHFRRATPLPGRDYMIGVTKYRHRMRLSGYPCYYYDARSGILTDGHDQCTLPPAFRAELEALFAAKLGSAD